MVSRLGHGAPPILTQNETQPKWFLAAQGASRVTQADPTKQSALLVIDVQADLFAEPQAVHDGPAVLARINGVIEQARRADVPVIVIQDDDVAPVGSEGWEVHPALAVETSDLRIQKAYADAFYQTCLLEELQRKGVKRVVVVGCTTDACIEMTCRGP